VDNPPRKHALAFWLSSLSSLFVRRVLYWPYDFVCVHNVPIFFPERRRVLSFNQNGFAPFRLINEGEFFLWGEGGVLIPKNPRGRSWYLPLWGQTWAVNFGFQNRTPKIFVACTLNEVSIFYSFAGFCS
jgi:hypothetical protein